MIEVVVLVAYLVVIVAISKMLNTDLDEEPKR